MFVIDTSSFVQAQKLYYAQDIVPGFWDLLTRLHNAGQVHSVDRVLSEIVSFHDKRDPLYRWCTQPNLSSLFASTFDSQVVSAYSALMRWVSNQERFAQTAVADFASAADGWVMAFAHVRKLTVVSMEVSAPRSKKSAKMPDICGANAIPHIDTYDFLRRVGASFS